MNSSKRITGKILSLILAIMMVFSLVTVGFSTSAANVEVAPTGAAPTTVYFTPKSEWKSDGAWFAAWTWGGSSSDAWVTFADEDGDGIYVATLAEGRTGMKMLRMNPSVSTPDWINGKWNESGDITIPTDGKNMLTQNEAWTTWTGTWSTYTPPVIEYTITFKSGLEGEQVDTVTVEEGTVPTAPTPKAVDGYNFTEWDKEVVAATTDTTYTAQYEKIAVPTTTTAKETEAPGTTAAQTTTAAPVVTDAPVEDPVVFDGFYWQASDGLYAYAGTVADGEIPDDNAWQRWDKANDNTYRYFYLPTSASSTEVIIYNTFSNDVTVGGTTIPAGEYKVVAYVDGEVLDVTGAEGKADGVKIMKSDADATLFINNAEGMTAKDKDEGATLEIGPNAALYSFLTGGTKNREAGGLGGAVADGDGIRDASVKKIKGRGNSTWGLAKKPFNITYNDRIEIDNMLAGKKWSLLANAQESSLLRNRIVYDMANEVGMKYACDSRFVDWFVNGEYLGSYQMTQKIEMGKGTVMSDLTEPEVEDVVEDDGTITEYPKENFDFILEMDTPENATSSHDRYFETDKGQAMTFKTPDDPAPEQVEFIMAKYQAVEDALYADDLATLETLIDLDDFAKAYLVNEVAKNIDAGVTSTYFTYSAAEDIFYLSPVWDYDNALGNSNNSDARVDMNGNQLNLKDPDGWYTRELKHYARDDRSVFSKAWYTTSQNAAGETFADVVKRVWNAEFLDLIDVLEGTAASTNGRLQTVDQYMTSLEKSGNWNYKYAGWEMVTSGWISDHSTLTMYDFDGAKLTSSTKNYDVNTLEGQAAYAGDWTISRLNWMASEYAKADVDPEETVTVYVGVVSYVTPTNLQVHYWNDGGLGGDADVVSTGETGDFAAGSDFWSNGTQNYSIYTAEVPAAATGLKLHDGDTWADMDLTYAEDQILLWFEYGGSYRNRTAAYTAPVEPTDAPDTTAAEDTTAADTTAADTTVTDAPETTAATTAAPVVTDPKPVEMINLYFTNNWKWTEVKAYYWTETLARATSENAPFPGEDMTLVGKNTDGDEIYTVEVPSNITGVKFSGIKDDGSGVRDESPDITEGIVDNAGFYMVWDNGNAVGTYTFDENTIAPDTTTTTAAPTTTKAEETTAAATTTKAEETTAAATTAAPTTPDEPVGTMTLYFTNEWKWTDVKAYWTVDSVQSAEWPGTAMEFVETTTGGYDVYKIEVPENIDMIIFNGIKNDGSGKMDQSPDITNPEHLVDGTGFYMVWDNGNSYATYKYEPTPDPTSTAAEETTAAEDTTAKTEETTAAAPTTPDEPATEKYYFVPNSNWTQANAWFAAWTWDGTADAWVVFTDADGDGIYEGDVPNGNVSFKFCRMNPTYTEPAWNSDTDTEKHIWNEANNTTRLEGTNMFTLDANMWSGATGTWSLYTEGTTKPTEAPLVVTTEDRTVYFTNSKNWSAVNIHYWNSRGEIEGTSWPGVAMTEVETNKYGQKIYSFVVPAGTEGIIFNGHTDTASGNDLQTVDILAEDITNGYVYYADTQTDDLKWNVAKTEYVPYVPDDTTPDEESTAPTGSTAATDPTGSTAATDPTEPASPDEPLPATTIYFVPSDDWKGADAWFAAYYWNAAGGTGWATLTDEDADGIYTCDVPGEFTDVKFVRMNPATDVTSWDNKWNESANQLVPTDDNNLFVIYPGWDGTGEWMALSDYTPVVPTEPAEGVESKTYIQGTFTDWGNNAIAMVYDADLNIVKANVTLAAGKYEFKIVDDGAWLSNVSAIDDTCDAWTFTSEVSANAVLNATGGEYTFSFDLTTKKLTITAVLDEVVYTATWDETDATFTVVTDSAEITEGENFTFTVEVAEGYEIGAVLNGSDVLTAVDGVYTIENVTADINLIIVTKAIEYKPITTYTVIFLNADGKLIEVQTVEAGADATAPADPTLDATAQYTYTFTGWDADFTNVQGNITVTAQYDETVNQYTYTFVGFEGAELKSETVDYGTAITAPEAPVVDGYEFKGWDKAFDTVTGDITITAIYEEIVVVEPDVYYTVVFVANGMFIKAETVKAGESATAPADPAGYEDAQYIYTFTGWDVAFDDVQGNLTVNALYSKTAKTFTVTFVGKDGQTIATETVEYGAAATAPEAPAVEGFTFTGWDVAYDNVTADITVTAQYKKVVTPPAPATHGTFKVDVVGGNGFTISVNGGAARPQGATYTSTSMPVGATVTLVANTIEGAEFIGWVNPSNGTMLSTDYILTVNTSGNDSYKAMYKQIIEGVNTVTFKDDKVSNGMGQILDMQYYASTDAISFPTRNPSAPGYDFMGWNMTEAEIQAELALGNDVTVLPVWERQLVYVTVEVIGGTVTDYYQIKDGKYLANTYVTVTANTPEAGMKFAYWTNGTNTLSYETVYTFNPKGDIVLTAVFVEENAEIEYQILTSVNSFSATDLDGAGTGGVFSTSWYVPEDSLNVTFVQAGLVAIDASNYDEATFYHGSGATGMYDKTSKSTSAIGTYNWTGPVTMGSTWYVKSFVIYKDNATGQQYTVYSDMFEVTKE